MLLRCENCASKLPLLREAAGAPLVSSGVTTTPPLTKSRQHSPWLPNMYIDGILLGRRDKHTMLVAYSVWSDTCQWSFNGLLCCSNEVLYARVGSLTWLSYASSRTHGTGHMDPGSVWASNFEVWCMKMIKTDMMTQPSMRHYYSDWWCYLICVPV